MAFIFDGKLRLESKKRFRFRVTGLITMRESTVFILTL